VKIATACRPDLLSFLPPIEKILATRHDVVSAVTPDGGILKSVAEEADVVWCEWANEVAQALATHTKARLVVRLHRYEAFSPLIQRIPWRRVSTLIVTSKHVLALACHRVPSLLDLTRCVVIPSGVDFDAFPWTERSSADMRRVGVCGYIHGRKQPGLWLQVLRALPPEYTLHIAGKAQQPEWMPYMRHMAERLGVADRLHVDGWQEDVAAWWRGKGHCLSASMDEGCPYNLIEAVACGALPWVHNYVGAEDQWPSAYRWDRPEEAAVQIASAGSGGDVYQWARSRYDLAQQAHAILDVVETAAGAVAA